MKLARCVCGTEPDCRNKGCSFGYPNGMYQIICPKCLTKTGHYGTQHNAEQAWNALIKAKQPVSPKNTIDLYTALAMIDSLNQSDDHVIYLRRQEDEPKHRPSIILSLKEVKEKYDMRKVKATNIRPYFICQEYEGLLLTITEDV